MPTQALKPRKIVLPDTPVIRMICIAPDVDDDYDGEVSPSYEQVEDKRGLNTPEEEIVDTRI